MSAPQTSETYASQPLPENLTVAGWRVALIIASFTFALPGFLNGAQTGLALGFQGAVLAAFIAGAILCAGACLTAVISVRTRLTTYVLVQRSFGVKGAVLVNLVMAIIHFCWFGVNVSFFGDAMVAAQSQGYGLPGDFNLFVIIGSILITLSTIRGFRTLDRLAMVAVPLVGLILVVILATTVSGRTFDLGPVAEPPVPMSFGTALSALVGANMLTVATMPDLARFVRTEKGAIAGMALSFPFAAPLLMVIASLIALATGITDIMQLVVNLGFGAPALLLLLLSVWTINALNLYSAGLSMAATFPRVKQWMFIVGGGAIGCTFAVMGIINSFIPFLVTLGLIIPPIAAIYVIDNLYTFANGRGEQTPSGFRWEAIGVWLGSLAITLPATNFGVTLTTVPALDATILAALAYIAVIRFRRPTSSTTS